MDNPPPPERSGPAFGAADGVRRDIQAAKEAGVPYDPSGIGVAWTHDFLNKKPWHPMNFRNRVRVWEAEQQRNENEARLEKARAEFEAEQQYLKTISMLSSEEQERYKQRQSVSWLYMKPPGYDAAIGQGQGNAKVREAANQGGVVNSQTATQRQSLELDGASRSTGADKHAKDRQSAGGNYVSRLVSGVHALVAQQYQYELKHATAFGMSPPRGAVEPNAENQKLIVAPEEDEAEEKAYRLLMMSEEERQQMRRAAKEQERRLRREEKQRKREKEAVRVREAKAVLRAAGVDIPGSSDEEAEIGDGHFYDDGNHQGQGVKEKPHRKHRRR